MQRLLTAMIVFALTVATAVRADERILEFDSDIEVFADGSMVVTEAITVRAEGQHIKRGIFRDFPTTYDDHAGRRVRVDFEVLEVVRDDAPENWFTKPLGNGVRVYAGRQNVLLESGEYRYRIRYRTTRQLGYFEEHDELYWNVTGNDWIFPIDRASARVRLPPGAAADAIRVEGYTGGAGSKGQDYEAGVDDAGQAWFRTTRGLGPREGLTLVTLWPKGVVAEPTTGERLGWFYRDNAVYLIGAAGIIVLLVFYAVSWHAVGKDPEPGVTIPLYEPPHGYSPASMRFVSRMGYDHQAFVAALVNLAVKGRIEIRDSDGEYEVARVAGASAALAPGEKTLLGKLFADGSRLELERSNHKRIRAAISAHEASLANDYEKLYFRKNVGFVVAGALLSIATVVSAVALVPGGFDPNMLTVLVPAIVLCAFGTVFVTRIVNAARTRSLVSIAPVVLFAVIFVCMAWPFFEAVRVDIHDFQIVFVVAALVVINLVFHYLMKAPTRRGRRLLDEIEGFREYMQVAERDELLLKNPPEKTPELFERFLPYAIALGVEGGWGEKFKRVLARAQREGTYRQPGWYHGGRWNGSRASGFASSLGSSLGATVASSSTAPGSSSGGGGGGSSGGGGGGGGGGGW